MERKEGMSLELRIYASDVFCFLVRLWYWPATDRLAVPLYYSNIVRLLIHSTRPSISTQHY